MDLNREEGLECEVHVDRTCLEHLSELIYLGCVLNEAGTEGTEFSKSVASGMRVAGAVRSLANAKDLQLECDSVIACSCSYVW